MSFGVFVLRMAFGDRATAILGGVKKKWADGGGMVGSQTTEV